MPKYYIAYGSNLSLEQMLHRCPDAKPVGTVEINNAQLAFRSAGGPAYLTLEYFPGRKTVAGVWEISEADEKNLDRYEGYPDFYEKFYMTNLPLKDMTGNPAGRIDAAMLYYMNPQIETEADQPSWAYIMTCLMGYGDFGIDDQQLVRASEYTESLIIAEGGNEDE